MSQENQLKGRSRPFFNLWRAGLCVLFGISILLYWPSLIGQAIWDDHAILGGEAIGGGTLQGALTQPFLSYFRPVTSLSFWLDHQIYAHDIFGYHVTNLLLHGVAALLVAWLGLLLFGKPVCGLFAGLVVAVHPAEVGAIAWVGGRVDALSVVLIALYCCLLMKHRGRAASIYLYGAGLTLFVAGLTKEVNLAFALLAPFAFSSHGGWKRFNPIYVAALVAGVLVVLNEPGLHKADAMSAGLWTERILAAANHYRVLLLSGSQDSLFTFSIVDHQRGSRLVSGGVFTLMISALAVLSSKLGSSWRFVWWGLLLAYLPASNLLPIPSLLVAPYRMAVPAIFLALLVGGAMERGRTLAPLLAVAWCALCAFTSFQAIRGWETELGFFAQVRKSDPYSIDARLNYISGLLKASRAKEAKEEAEEMLKWVYGGAAPTEPAALKKVAENGGANNDPKTTMAILFFFHGASQDALGEDGFPSLETAYKLDPKNADVLAAMGDHYLSRDRARAVAFYEESVKHDPKDWENLRRLAKQRFIDHRVAESEKLYRQALAEAPLASVAWYELSLVLEQQGRFAEAIRAMQEAEKGISVDPEGFRQRILELRAKQNAAK